LIRRYATRGKAILVYDPRRKHGPLALKRSLDYFGFELESEMETIEEFPPELAGEARHLLAESLARGEARHIAVKKNREAIEEVREAYKRSGGETTRLGLPELIAAYAEQLGDVRSVAEFKSARMSIETDRFVPRDVRDRLQRLPSQVAIRDREVDIDYDVEERDGKRVGVARLRLPEKIARTLTELEVPQLDRPVRFVVLRGQRGAVRADNLEDLQERLAQPYSPDEVEEAPGDDAMLPNAEREVRRIAGEFRRHRRGGRKGERGSGAPRGRSDLRKRRRRR